MLKGFLLLIAAQLAGIGLQAVARLPVPGPVIGMFLLALLLAQRPRVRTVGLEQIAGGLLRHMGLLFVPAGVGLIDHLDLLRTEALPLVAGLAGSTLLSLVATALVMQWHDKLPSLVKGGFHARHSSVR